MERPSERDRTVIIFFHERRVVIRDRRQFVFLRARTQATGDQECRDRGGEKDNPEHEAIDDAGRTEHHGGRAPHRGARDAAPPRRPRPSPPPGPAACTTPPSYSAQEPTPPP